MPLRFAALLLLLFLKTFLESLNCSRKLHAGWLGKRKLLRPSENLACSFLSSSSLSFRSSCTRTVCKHCRPSDFNPCLRLLFVFHCAPLFLLVVCTILSRQDQRRKMLALPLMLSAAIPGCHEREQMMQSLVENLVQKAKRSTTASEKKRTHSHE